MKKENEKKKEDEKENEKKVQEKYIELQTIALGLKELQRNIQTIDEQTIEVLSITQALKDLKNVPIGTESFVTISPGIFVKAELKDNKELLVNVGAGVTVKKSIEEVMQMLDTKMAELRNQRQSLLQDLEELGVKAQELEDEIKGLVENV